MWQQGSKDVVFYATEYDVRHLLHSRHHPQPRLVNVGEAFCLSRQLLGNVTADEHCLQVDPQVLYHRPVLDNLQRV